MLAAAGHVVAAAVLLDVLATLWASLDAFSCHLHLVLFHFQQLCLLVFEVTTCGIPLVLADEAHDGLKAQVAQANTLRSGTVHLKRSRVQAALLQALSPRKVGAELVQWLGALNHMPH